MLAEKTSKVTKEQLASLYMLMVEHDDLANASKILDLYEKLSNDEFHVSFTGHFSAGKSSIINYLLGKELLPKSPIPTSANIVKITSGAGVARVFFNEQNPVEYDEPYDIDMIKDFCMTKDTIKQIEIHTSEPLVPKGSFIVDTPGIDAADDADRYMTESSLHLVDVLYYVMDYNHVQSEINFSFLKQIQQKNIPIYLVINQVDKHNEEELTFAQFKQSVEQSFEQWGIFTERIYYSSIMDQQLPYNELQTIKDDLFTLLHEKGSLDEQIYHATEQVIQSHREQLEKQYEQQVSEFSTESFDTDKWEEILNRINELNEMEAKLAAEFNEEMDQTLKNAYVMPAKLRDLAEQFLLSQEPNFKVGFFQAKKKTELEKEKRLNEFLSDLQQSVQSTIVWKLREKFAQIIQNYEIGNEKLRQEAQNFSLDVTEELLFNSLKEGATVNGNYVLNYTNEISHKIKQQCKRDANDLLAKMQQQLAETSKEEKETLQVEKEKLEVERKHLLEQSDLYDTLQAKLQQIDHVMENEIEDDAALTVVNEKVKERYQFVKEEVPEINDVETNTNEIKETVEEKPTRTQQSNLTAEEIVPKIDEAVSVIRDLADFNSLIDSLLTKKERIENRSLTIALFGAFSAGKSSFSNALLGEKVLPVSPNPTTAVINRIQPVTETNGHGKVVITYKSDEVLTDDLLTITKDFSPNCTNTEQFVEWIKRDKVHENDRLSKVYQSYLVAILEGYESRGSLLGKQEVITIDDFASYVTDESIAAYIEAVDLYYDNELTRQGITLVDTPGANSVNARHTNVAFDYIKDADAIIYVTYYNHAVTSADRDFLIQLGRVKESFELDKMFFIVNASDLAKDDAELKLVVDYVEDQLLQYGIRHAQIYPLSSKKSLQEKVNNETLNEQMETFESTFYHFIEHDLHALTYEAAIWDINRVKTRLENIIQSAKLDESEREKQIIRLQEKQSEGLKLLENKIADNLVERAKERIERQLHFVKERMFIRFHDMFQEHFNPTTVTENGRQALQQLESNRNRLIDYVGYELLQEVRAVSLRLEAFINQLLKDFYEEVSRELLTIDETITLANYEDKRFTTPNYEQAFTQIDLDIFQRALKIFKNLRSYFEQNDREKMKDTFYEILEPEIEVYLNEQKLNMEEAYLEQLNQLFTLLLRDTIEEVNMIIKQQINVLNTEIDITKYSEKLDQIKLILDNLDSVV